MTIILKTWNLDRSFIDENDLRWCQSLGVTIRVEPETRDFVIQGSMSNFKVAGRIIIEICTSTEKQESALLLKYGSDLRLVEEKIINLKL